MIGAAAALSPTARRALLTVCTMTATIMQALDTTIANVALPYMQGSLSASLDQVSWVLTSYIVAAAVMTAPVGWLSDRFGRKKLFLVCVGGFTFASLLCALAQNIEQIVAFRLMQGMCGAALVPLSQSVMLDAYPIEQRGQAMGIWGVGVMLGPIMGPTLGGWLTENYSWHWVFLVNLPVGAVTVLGLLVFMDETKRQGHLKFDWFGFLALAAGIGGMQLMLDRGEQLGWFGSPEIVAWLIISIVGFYYFFAHSFTTPEPFVRFAIFKDRNFLVGCFFMVIMGLMLFSSMALSAPFIQNVLNYPIESAGWVLASRGLGTLVGMLLIGRLLRMFEARYLILIGLTLTALTMYQMTGFTADTSGRTIVIIGLVQGFGMGFVFIPLSTVAFLTLAPRYRTDGTSMLTLVRNVASSAGISVVIANLTNMTTTFHSQLVEHVTPFNDALQHPDVSRWMDLGTDQGRALADQMVTLQAVIMAYANDFMLLTVICALSIPFVFFIGSTASLRGGRVSVREHAPAME
jgi:MFS transporter, DHA2 family, multidrug resistance protein